MVKSRLERVAVWARIATCASLVLSALDLVEWVLSIVVEVDSRAAPFDLIYRIYEGIAVLLFIVFIICGYWIFVAARHFEGRADPTEPIRPHWAVWSNLIPLINCISPFIQLRRIYNAANPAAPSLKWLWVWWGAWVYPFIIGMMAIAYIGLYAPQLIIENGFPIGWEIVLLTTTFSEIVASVLFLRLIAHISAPKLKDSDVFA